jgi:hypothetical protein
MKYVGQTGKTLQTPLPRTLSNTETIMETIHITNNGQMIDTLQRYYVFRVTKPNNQINDKFTVKPN